MKKFSYLICTLMALVSIALVGCEKKENQDETVAPLKLSAAEKQARDVTNDYSFSFLKAVYADNVEKQGDKNCVVSPLSAAMVLAMLENGANGDTRTQILETLGFKANQENDMNNFYHRMMVELPTRTSYAEVIISNSVWAKNGLEVKEEYKNALNKHFMASTKNYDFTDPKTADIINSWCANNTKNHITKIVEADEIIDASMVLINALYFKNDWAAQFDAEKTKDGVFYAEDKEYNMDFMHREGTYRTMKNGTYLMLEMDYKGGAYCMDFILPNGSNKVADVVESLDATAFENVLEQLASTNIDVAIPRLKISSNYILNDALIAIGIQNAFDIEKADFSKISTDPLFVSLVKQKTFIELNEKGAEAAAVTGGMTTGATAPGAETFYVDRPFVLILRERQSNIILFAGVIVLPE